MKYVNIIFLALLCTYTSQVSAETIMMSCNDGLYKYSKSFLRTTTIEIRQSAEWKPWCKHQLSVSDKGARCVYTRTYQSTVQIEKQVDGAYQFQQRFRLKLHHKKCNEAQKNKSAENWAEAADCEIDNSSYDFIGYDNFWEVPLDEHVLKHTTPIGEKYTVDEQREMTTEVTETLDFLTSEHSFINTDQQAQSSFYKCEKT